jgi:hypothetical protein
MSILDNVVSLNETKSTGIVIVIAEVGAGKTTWTKSMPDAADGDILYLPVGNDQGYNQLKSDERFKTLVDKDGKVLPIKTIYEVKKGVRVAIKKRVLKQITELLEEFLEGNHDFKGINVDAISTIQEQIENEIKFDTNKNIDWDGWSAIKKGMFRIYELLEEIADAGYHVVLQSHFQIREYTDNYSGETMSRTLPMMTENNAIRILKNASAVVFIKVMSDPKDPTSVRRMSIVGGHPTIPTKLRNEHALSFDDYLFENLDYAGCLKLMELDSLEGIEGVESLENIKIKQKGAKPKKKKSSKKKKETKQTEEVEDSVKEKPKKKKSSKKKSMRKSKNTEPVEEDKSSKKKKPPKKKKPSKKKTETVKEETVKEDTDLEEFDDEFDDDDLFEE